jgi:anthranilate synthase component II
MLNKSPILFFENKDSFYWNVIDALPFSRADIKIIYSDSRFQLDKNEEPVKAVIIGPGPMDPERTGLIEIVKFYAEKKIPILGICLGFQAIGMAFGAKLIRTNPIHGKQSLISFSPSRYFPDFIGKVEVMRYHSLALSYIKSPLNLIASTREGIPMAFEHEYLPIAGLQFHPDSFATPRGKELLSSFFEKVL